MKSESALTITMTIEMTNVALNDRGRVLKMLIKDIEKGINRGSNKKIHENTTYSFETTLSSSERVSEFFNK